MVNFVAYNTLFDFPDGHRSDGGPNFKSLTGALIPQTVVNIYDLD